MNISSSGLFAKIKQISGVTPNRLILSMRLKKAAELLSEGKYRVNEVCYRVGFNNPSYFAKCFRKQFGKLPKEFISGSDEKTEN
jgi:AraC-like DNA-binding protein